MYQQPTQDKDTILNRVKQQLDREQLLTKGLISHFDLLLAIIKAEIPGNQIEKRQQINKRIKKFFDYGEHSIDIEKGHFCIRKQPKYDKSQVVPISNQLVLFGVDFLSTRRIKKLFPELDPKVRWIDNSNCKIIFQSFQCAAKGLNIIIDRSKYPDSIKLDQKNLPQGWFECYSYREITYQRILQCRFATTQEKFIQPKASLDYELYLRAKKKFETDLFTEFRGPLAKYIGRQKHSRQKQYNRSRSRDKNYRQSGNPNYKGRQQTQMLRPKQKTLVQEVDVDLQSESNYSFILDGKSVKSASQKSQGSIINRINHLNFDASFRSGEIRKETQQEIDLSFLVQEQQQIGNKSFSYLSYVENQEEKQKSQTRARDRGKNMKKAQKAQIIDLDD